MHTVFRILITAVFSAALFLGGRFLSTSPLQTMVQFKSLPAFAGNISAACILVLLVWCFASSPICIFFEGIWFRIVSMGKIRKMIRNRQRSLMNWLLSRPAHWGITATASEPQYATTCEGILAIRGAGFFDKKRESCRSALQTLVDAAVPTGLPSRTVNRPTVINTAMLLMIASMEKQASSGVIESFETFDEMTSNLWFLRAENGWGPLVLKADKKECRLVNTWWALRALYRCGYLDLPEEKDAFRQLLLRIYEKNRGGTFGYTSSDSPRLCVTSMYLILYYELPSLLRRDIAKDYDPRSAAEFIMRRFCSEKCQVEVESVDGTFAGGSFIAHTPWKHISSAYAMQALSAARRNGALRKKEMDEVYMRTAEILSADLRSPAVNESCYIPSDAELPRTGAYTFAAAHLIMGLQALM